MGGVFLFIVGRLADAVELACPALFTALTPKTAEDPPNTVTKNISLLLDTQFMLINVNIVADQTMIPSEAKRLNRSTQNGGLRGVAIMQG